MASPPTAEARVKRPCAVRGARATSTARKRAARAAVDAFAGFGAGEAGGYTVGSFAVRNYGNADNGSAATKAAIKELVGAPYIFCGIR